MYRGTSAHTYTPCTHNINEHTYTQEYSLYVWNHHHNQMKKFPSSPQNLSPVSPLAPLPSLHLSPHSPVFLAMCLPALDVFLIFFLFNHNYIFMRHHQSLGKCKSSPHWAFTSHLPEDVSQQEITRLGVGAGSVLHSVGTKWEFTQTGVQESFRIGKKECPYWAAYSALKEWNSVIDRKMGETED